MATKRRRTLDQEIDEVDIETVDGLRKYVKLLHAKIKTMEKEQEQLQFKVEDMKDEFEEVMIDHSRSIEDVYSKCEQLENTVDKHEICIGDIKAECEKIKELESN